MHAVSFNTYLIFKKIPKFETFEPGCHGNEWKFWKTKASFNTQFVCLYSDTMVLWRSVTMIFWWLKCVKHSERNLRYQLIFYDAWNACGISDFVFNHLTSIERFVSWTVGNRLKEVSNRKYWVCRGYPKKWTILVCKRINNSEADSLDWRDSPKPTVIVVTNSYSCFRIELLCQTKPFMQFDRLNRLSKRLHEIDWL